MNRYKYHKGITTLIVACVLAGSVAAQTTREFNIPAQDLAVALEVFARQADKEVLFDREQTEGKQSAPVQGSMEPAAALRALMGWNTLAIRQVNEQTFVIGHREAQLAAQGAGVKLARVDGNVSSGSGVGEPSSQGEDQSEDSKQQRVKESEEGEDSERGGIPEILVTGAKMSTLNMDIRRTENDAQPYMVFDREVIENSPFANLHDFFRHSLTMSTTEGGNAQTGSTFGNTSSINLRGLGSDETLILVDGHRMASMNATLAFGALQPDINSIPLSAIERIEVLPTTASGLYGGGATGGVINIVLRRDYSGLDLKLTYGNTFKNDVSSRRVDVTAGQALWGGRTTLLFAGSFADSNALLTGERDFIQRGRRHILATNPASFYEAQRPPLGATPNIRSATGERLTLKDGTTLNSLITFIPVGYAGTSTDGGAALLANAGQYNLELANTAQGGGGKRVSLLNSPTVKSAMLTLRQEFTSSIQGFLELEARENSGRSTLNQVSISETISAAAPNNPFQQDIFVTVPSIGADGEILSEARSRKVIAGLIGKLPGGWQIEGDFTWNKTGLFFRSTVSGGLLPATGANIRSGAIDVLRDVNQFGFDLGELVAGPVSPEADTVLKDSALRIAGPLPLRLPGGNVTLTGLVEHREEAYGENSTRSAQFVFVRPSQSQSVDSLYMEAHLPIVAGSRSVRGIDELELQVAIRRDEYETWVAPEPTTRFRTALTSTDPTIGLRYKPSSDLMLRASYGTGFLPASTVQLSPDPPIPALANLGLTDPLRGNEPILSGDILSGGRSGLRPEESVSKSVGAVITPRWLTKLRVSADWSRTEKTDNITSVATFSQTDLENEAFVPGLIIRGPRAEGDPFPVGPVIALNGGPVNIATFRVDALDLAFGYEFDVARAGSFDVAIRTTYLDSLETQFTPAAPVVENAGVSGWGLKWRANGSIAWRRGGWTLGWATRFLDSYYVNSARTMNADQGTATVASQTYHDLFGRYRLDAGGFWANTELQFGASNVFNKAPPIDVATGLVNRSYSMWGDPRLANYYVSIRKSFGN